MVGVVIRPWPLSVAACATGDVLPGQRVDRVEQGAPVLLHGEHELAAALVDEARGGLHRVQCIGRHDLAAQVKPAEDHLGPPAPRSSSRRPRPGRRPPRRRRPADAGREQPDLGPVSVPDRLAVQPDLHQGRRATSWPAPGPVSPARSISHVPAAASSSPVPASVSTRQIVVFDGGGAGAAPHRRYRPARTGDGTSATHPEIAVYPFIPATTAAAASASTPATGWSRPCRVRPSGTPASSSSRSQSSPGTGRETMGAAGAGTAAAMADLPRRGSGGRDL